MTLIDRQERPERAHLAEVIDNRTDEIIERWLAVVGADAAVRRVPVTDMRDGIHDYLKRLAMLLRSGSELDGLGAATWRDVAREHALTRVRLGFDVSQLTQELFVLRYVTKDVLEEEELANTPQGERLLRLFDDALKSTLRSYIDFRDYESRRVEAEHIGFLTHELKNPLGSAVLAVDELRREQLTPIQRRLCDMLDRSLERMRTLVEDVLLTERLEIGEVEPKPVDITLGQLLDDEISVFRRLAAKKSIELAVEYDPTLVIHVDPQLTISAIQNLIDNAIKYTDAGTVTFIVEERANDVLFHVRDHCQGLSPEELRVIFEPFKRVHSKKPGSGLGLAIARRAVEAQGGTMHAESAEDVGCHFWFTLPKMHH